MAENQDKPKTLADELKQLKVFRLIMIPIRILVALSVMALVAGGPRRFFYEPAGLVFAGVFCLYLVVERIFQTPDAGGQEKDQGSIKVIWLTSSATYLLAVAEYYWLRPHWEIVEWNWIWALVGALVSLAGMLLRVQAMRALGRYFTISVRTHSEQKLIQEGLYARVRHPAYTGLLLIVAGFVTVFASLAGYLALMFMTLPGLLNRIRIEERALTGIFGDEYREYCSRTKRLVPFVY